MPDHLKTLKAHASEELQPARQERLSAGERIALFKRFLKIEEHRIKLRHRAGAGGLEIARSRAELLDTVLTSVFEVAMEKRKHGSGPLALVAIGGYGRSTLNPGSDIDLLFLLPRASNKLSAELTEVVNEVLYLLWDVGFKVGHSCRSGAECIAQAKEDQESKTSLMDARLIAGDTKLFADFLQRFDRNVIQKDKKRFFELRRADLRTRHQKHSHTVFLQEPNVKEGCGGLRDYHTILWDSRVKRGDSNIASLVEDRLLTRTALREIQEAYDFIHRVRNELHYHTGRATDILTLHLQGVVATAFNYPQRSILRRTEAFMRDYYRHTRNLYQHSTSLMEIFEIDEQDQSGGIRSFLTFRKKHRETFDGFVAKEGRIYPLNQNIFKEDPHRLMRLFQHCQVRGLKLSPPMRKLVKAHYDLIDRPFRYAKATRQTFQAILERKGDVARALRQMHRVGFLGRYLPEFGALDCLVQHEFFHRYTADEHTLRCIEEFDALVGTTDPGKQRYERLLREVGDPYALYLALILHDTGRAENVREHTDGSAMLASRLCNRLQIQGPRRTLIMFLVDHHLTFWRFATQRNIEDPDVVAEFASLMKSPSRLDALLLFTYADSNGTNEEAWSGWKESLLLQLHASTRRFLTDGREKFNEDIRADKETLRQMVTQQLKEDAAEDIAAHFARMPGAYFRFRGPAAVAIQIRAVRQFLDREEVSEKPFECAVQWIDYPERGYTELIVVTRDRPLLMEKLCCALASEQINILSADVFTRSDEIVLDLFRVCTTNFEPVSDRRSQLRVVETIYALNSQLEYDPSQYLRRQQNFLRPRGSSGLYLPARAHISNFADPSHTTVEVQALDRIGLLHDLFHAINRLGLTTAHARICTEKGAAVDTLYITRLNGGQVTSPAELEALQRAIEEVVHQPEA
jgi:[protein-PII] uridylyltransferase